METPPRHLRDQGQSGNCHLAEKRPSVLAIRTGRRWCGLPHQILTRHRVQFVERCTIQCFAFAKRFQAEVGPAVGRELGALLIDKNQSAQSFRRIPGRRRSRRERSQAQKYAGIIPHGPHGFYATQSCSPPYKRCTTVNVNCRNRPLQVLTAGH